MWIKSKLIHVKKSLPLEAPTEIELEPGNTLRVTLFDANHCPGAVMFCEHCDTFCLFSPSLSDLIVFENHGTAVLYTGDIRSEPWYVNSLARSPCLIEYVSGLKTLDRVYLDTSFTEDIEFQTKAQGLRELIEKVKQYPKDTVFHFSAWTYGYEEVWIALAKALGTQVRDPAFTLHVWFENLTFKQGSRRRLQIEHVQSSPGQA